MLGILSSPFRFSPISVYKPIEKMHSHYLLDIAHNLRTQGTKEMISKQQEVFFLNVTLYLDLKNGGY